MSQRILYGLAWALCAALLLAAGFAAVVIAGAAIAVAHAAPGIPFRLPTAFAVYGAVVMLKGLLPALLLALALWALLDRVARLRDRGPIAVALGLFATATLGSVAAAGLLLPLPTRAIGAVHYTGVENFLRTCAEMAVPVALSAWLPRALLPHSRRALALVSAAIVVAFVAGGVWVARLVPQRAPAAESAPPAAAPQPPPTAAPPAPDAAASLAALGIAPRDFDPAANESPVQPLELGWEEIQRRQQLAERLRALIEAGPDAAGHPVVDGGLLAEGEPVPVYRDGGLAGIALHNLPPDGFYTRLGLREGDVVGSVNGVRFDEPEVAGALLGALIGGSPLELEVERSDGTTQRIAVPSERVVEGLRALE
jgi:hypothetical protein